MTKNYFQKFEPYHFSTNQKKGFYFLEQADEYSFEKNILKPNQWGIIIVTKINTTHGTSCLIVESPVSQGSDASLAL